MNSIQLRAPAKINLSFRIRHRRDDGFHEIETVMTPISLFDELTIERSSAGAAIDLTCDDPSLSVGADNLVTKAAGLFLAASQSSAGLRIHLTKKIPHGAGLGGGSSDAASTLLGLNELLATGFDTPALARMAAQLGSDVPFFIYRSAAICRGRGELVEPTTLPQKLPLLLLKPAFGVPTPWAFSRWQDARALPGIDYAEQRIGDLVFVNDLERPVFEKYPFLAHLKMWLLAQPEVGAAMLSGSGATLFAVMRATADAQAVAARARAGLDPDLWTSACEIVSSGE